MLVLKLTFNLSPTQDDGKKEVIYVAKRMFKWSSSSWDQLKAIHHEHKLSRKLEEKLQYAGKDGVGEAFGDLCSLGFGSRNYRRFVQGFLCEGEVSGTNHSINYVMINFL